MYEGNVVYCLISRFTNCLLSAGQLGYCLIFRFTNCLLSAEQLGCTEEMLSIVSLLTAENVFQVSGNNLLEY